ncbi:MAG: PAS domain-containing protein [Betaproteobacteria bacterium]|nr:PAS domain-containing protein [Betaproteobacteria bacterium]
MQNDSQPLVRPHPSQPLDPAIEALRPALDVLMLPTAYVGQARRYLLANTLFLQWLGRPADKVLGHSIRDVVGADMHARILPHIEAALSGRAVGYEREDHLLDGTERWAKVTFSPHRSPSGDVLGFIASVQDIKDLKDLEKQTRRREERLRLITDNIGLPISYIDRDFVFRFSNRTGLLGLELDERDMVGCHVVDVFGQKVFDEVRPHLEAALSGRKVVYERHAKRGEVSRWIRTTLVPDIQEDGVVAGVYTVVADVDQDFQLRHALERKEAQLRLITDNIDAPISYLDREYRFQFVNRPSEDWSGRPASAILGRTLEEVLGAKAFSEIRDHVDRALAGETVRYERRADWATGDPRWIRNHLFPDRQPDGTIAGIYTLITDITDDHRLREELANREADMRRFADRIPFAIAYLDTEGRYTFVNAAFESARGRSRAQILGRTTTEVIGAEAAEENRPFRERALRGEVVDFEREVTLADGRVRWYRVHQAPDYDAAGRIAGIYVIAIDIHEQKIAELALRESEAELRTTMDSVPYPLAYIDADLRFRQTNSAYQFYTGFTSEAMHGRRLEDVFEPGRFATALPNLRRALAGETFDVERLIPGVDGRPDRWLRIRYTPRRNASGAVIGFYSAGVDIDDMKRTELALRESERELRAAMDSVPFPLAYIDHELRVQAVNAPYAHNMKMSREELIGKSLGDLFGAERVVRARPNLARVLAGEVVDIETRVQIPRIEKEPWYKLRYTPRFNAEGNVIGFYTAASDIDDIKRTELALRHANAMLEYHFENTPLAVIEWSRDRQLLRWSTQAEKMFGWTHDELKSLKWDDWTLVYEEDEPLVRQTYERLLAGEQRRATTLNRNYRKDGRVIWCEWYNSSLVDENGAVVSVLSLGQDVTARVLAEERLQHLATHDALTGLPNRVLLLERLRQAVSRARRSGLRVCALFIDLDRFKEVNDTLGHRIGDELLREMSVRLGRVVRESDLLVRLSGDEFMVVLEQVTDLDAPRMVAQKLLDEIREPSHIEGHEIYLSASVGLSLFPDDGDDAETLIRNADLAMYRAKSQGKNTFQMFTTDMAAHGAEMRLLENALRSAIARQELELYYQPVFELASGRLIGAEALLRWHHPTRGTLTPGAFIHLAEESGLIHDIGNWVLDAALDQMRAWHAAGANIRMAINLSAGQFRAVHFTDRIREKLRRSGCPPSLVELEVTETSLLQDAEIVGHMLAELRDMGVRVAIDDFGTGYSSLSHLKRFPIDTLKVDRSFVVDILEDADDAAIVSAVIALGQALQLDVTAEGVESVAQREWLAARGCHAAQGYLSGPPMPAAEFAERFLAQR